MSNDNTSTVEGGNADQTQTETETEKKPEGEQTVEGGEGAGEASA